MTQQVSDEEFAGMMAGFRREAFRLETRGSYSLTYEREAFERFLAGSPLPPPQYPWWREWLDQIEVLAGEGKVVERVRILDEPPTDYQRSEMYADPWHTAAGERISYMARSRAIAIGLPVDTDWWLFDSGELVIMHFASDGSLAWRELITDPMLVRLHCAWRDLARTRAIPAAAA